MHVRAAGPADARAVAAVHVDGWQAAYRHIVPAAVLDALSVDRHEAMWRDAIFTGRPELRVAQAGGPVLGWIAIGASRDVGAAATDAEVWAFYTAPAAWAGGVGRALWRDARERLCAQGFTRCSLWAFPQNERAGRFYSAAGFALEPASEKMFMLGDTPLREVRYACGLDV